MARRTQRMTISVAIAGTTADSAKISGSKGVHQGQMVGWKVTAPAWTNNPTYTLRIKDQDGDTIYNSAGGHADGGTLVVMGLNIPLIEKEIINLTLSGAPGGASILDAYVWLYYNPDAIIP